MTGHIRFGVLLASGGAPWETAAVEAVAAAGPGVALVRRCLDVSELLAAASTGTAKVAVVSDVLPGLDADAVAHLGRYGTRVLAVAHRRPGERPRLERLGVAEVLTDVGPDLGLRLREVVAASDPTVAPARETGVEELSSAPTPGEVGRLVTVWSAHGAPGRTTVAVGLGSAAAQRGVPAFLLDADPYGGAVAQHLGVTEEASGLLAAVRSANAGRLDPARLAAVARQVGPRLRLLTGLPRPDRWRELRQPALEAVLDEARMLDPVVVVDTGPGLPSADGPDPLPDREQLVGAAVAAADVLVAVLTPDPVGLARGVRALADVAEVRPEGPQHVVVNRWRHGLGWVPEEVRDAVGRVCPDASVHFLPDDRSGIDRALATGRPVTDSRRTPAGRALRDLGAAVLTTSSASERD